MDKNVENLLLDIYILVGKMIIYLAKSALISLFFVIKIIILAIYSNFTNFLLKKRVEVLLKYIRANKHAIELKKDKKLLHGSIYWRKIVELKTFNIYIKINLANNFIKTSKLLARTLIYFIKEPDGSARLCIYYQELNYHTIKN